MFGSSGWVGFALLRSGRVDFGNGNKGRKSAARNWRVGRVGEET